MDGGITFTEPTAIISGDVDGQQNVSRENSAPAAVVHPMADLLVPRRLLFGCMMHVSHQVRGCSQQDQAKHLVVATCLGG